MPVHIYVLVLVLVGRFAVVEYFPPSRSPEKPEMLNPAAALNRMFPVFHPLLHGYTLEGR